MSPVAALWLVAIPLWDCVGMIAGRFASGKAAFEADRNHIHHILFDRTTLSGYWPLISILITSLILEALNNDSLETSNKDLEPNFLKGMLENPGKLSLTGKIAIDDIL